MGGIRVIVYSSDLRLGIGDWGLGIGDCKGLLMFIETKHGILTNLFVWIKA